MDTRLIYLVMFDLSLIKSTFGINLFLYLLWMEAYILTLQNTKT